LVSDGAGADSLPPECLRGRSCGDGLESRRRSSHLNAKTRKGRAAAVGGPDAGGFEEE